MKTIIRVCLEWSSCMGIAAESQAGIITLAYLPSPPATHNTMGLFLAINNNSLYQGISWDLRVNALADVYCADTTTPVPLYGIPHLT
jgi:hypothetical protein